MEANERVQLASPILGILKGKRKERKHNTKYSVFLHLFLLFSFPFPFYSASQEIRNLYFFLGFYLQFSTWYDINVPSIYVLYRESWRSLFKGMKLFIGYFAVGKNIKPLIEHELSCRKSS